MMKLTFSILLMLLALPALAGDHGAMKTESGWFDMENCAFCKNLVEDPGLLSHSTWENYNISNGSMSIMTVDPAYAESMARAGKAMEELGTKMQTGQVDPTKVEMCGHCQAFGMLIMSGARLETIEGKVASVTLITSDDPKLVARIQEMTDRDNKEMASIAGHDHGHDHSHGHQH